MRISDAIRFGCIGTEQCHDRLKLFEDAKEKTCALGAALIGVGIPFSEIEESYQWKGILPDIIQVVPHDLLVKTLGSGSPRLWTSFIVELNDTKKWTREAIADFLDEHLYRENTIKTEIGAGQAIPSSV